MKTPKASTPIVKSKLKTPKLGMVRKSLGSTPVSKVNLSGIKGKEKALSVIEDNEDSVQLMNKKSPKKARMSLPAKLLEKNESKDGIKSPKTPKGKGFIVSTSENKKVTKTNSAQKKKFKGSPNSKESENNSSPVKQGSPKANKGKLPFSLDKGGNPKQRGSMSPEVRLGLQLEKALSPETLGKKRKNVFADKGKAKKQAVGKKGQNKTEKLTKKKIWWKKEKSVHKENQANVQSIFQLANVESAVTSFLKMKSKSAKTVSEIPKDERKVSIEVKLQNGSLNKNIKKNKSFKVKLLHSILPEKPKVCLITADLKDKKGDPDATVAFYEDFLKQKDVSHISQVIPISKFQEKHGEPDKMKKFCDQYDLIFIEARVALIGRIGFKLGKYTKNVILITLHVNKKDSVLKGYVEGALRMSSVSYVNSAQNLSIQCGRLDMGSDKLIENIMEVGRFLETDRPVTGTKELLSSAALVSPLSQPVAFYFNSEASNKVAEQEKSKLGKKGSSESLKEAKAESKLTKTKENKKKGNLKKPVVKVQEEVESDDDDEESEDEESSLGLEVSSVEDEDEEGSEVEDDDSEEEEGLDEEVDSDEEEEGSGDEESTDEEEIETVEKEYLTELRKEQDDFQKERSKIIKKNKGGKPDAPNNQIKKPQKPGNQQNENKNQKNKQQMNQNRQQQQLQKNQQRNQNRPQQNNQNRPQQNNQNKPQQYNQNRPQHNSPNFGKNKKPFGGGGNKFGGKPQNQNSRNNQQSPNQKSKFEKKNYSKFSKPQGNQQSPKFKNKNFNKNN